jgi:hypothetical protein
MGTKMEYGLLPIDYRSEERKKLPTPSSRENPNHYSKKRTAQPEDACEDIVLKLGFEIVKFK